MRKAYVQNILVSHPVWPQSISPYYANMGSGGKPVPRPFLGGTATGYHAMPKQNDQLWIAHEIQDAAAYPIGSLSVTDTPDKLFILNPGESVQLGSDGRQLGYIKSDGSTISFLSADGNCTITIGADNHVTIQTNARLDLTATGGVYANNVKVGG